MARSNNPNILSVNTRELAAGGNAPPRKPIRTPDSERERTAGIVKGLSLRLLYLSHGARKFRTALRVTGTIDEERSL